MKFGIKKLFLMICCISLTLMSDVHASSQADHDREMISYRGALCLFALGACIFLHQVTPPLKIVHVCNESDKLIYIQSDFIEKLVGPGQQVTLSHRFLPLGKICARTNDWDEKCTTDKSAAFDGIKTWYVDKDLVLTPDFAHHPNVKVTQSGRETLDADLMQYRFYEGEKNNSYITLHKNNLRGSGSIDKK
ncbi:hypothetical protein [Candidatus Chromulinivorax destructor]|nr:hypothetical protein [Candidatus Chromulinivorax destructor]